MVIYGRKPIVKMLLSEFNFCGKYLMLPARKEILEEAKTSGKMEQLAGKKSRTNESCLVQSGTR